MKQWISIFIIGALLIGLLFLAIESLPPSAWGRDYIIYDADKPPEVPPCPEEYRDGLKP